MAAATFVAAVGEECGLEDIVLGKVGRDIPIEVGKEESECARANGCVWEWDMTAIGDCDFERELELD